MYLTEAILTFAGPKLASVVAKALQIGVDLPAIAAIVIPHALDDAIEQLEAEIAKRVNPIKKS